MPRVTKKESARLPTMHRDLQRRMKSGYRWVRTGGGHYRLQAASGRWVEVDGKVVTLGSNPSAGVERAIEETLQKAGVFRGAKKRYTSLEAEQGRRRGEAMRAANAARFAKRAEEAKQLRERLLPFIGKVGGPDTPGIAADLGAVGAIIARAQGPTDITPDLFTGSARRVLHGAWVEPRYQEVWNGVADHLERAPDAVGEWYTLIREARGLPSQAVEVRQPEDEEWPFHAQRLPLTALFADEAYQRPVGWDFVRREAARFDAALVGTIDVAQRSPSRFALLDGQQRTEICRLVGKETIWAAVYVGLDEASEARYFLKKNRNRKSVHPFYTFRARVAAEEPDALEIQRIVNQHGYSFGIGVPRDDQPDVVAAIAAVEKAWTYRRPDGSECLSPTLATMRAATHGRRRGKESIIIRGIARLYSQHDADTLHDDVLREVILDMGPELILGRARDVSMSSGVSGELAVARVLTGHYDRAVGRAGKLPRAA